MAFVDLFTELRECLWRGVSFPIQSLRFVVRQDLVHHRFVGRDGADIEGTGRAPLEISAQIPFFNHIRPGPHESWTPGTLYPTQWRLFLSAFQDKSTGLFQHPELGMITCKPDRCETIWDHATRNGVPVTASWIETTDDPNALQSLISALSPLAAGIQAAKDIDDNLKVIQPPLPTNPPTFAPNFQDTMRGLQSVFDQATLLQRRVAGTIDNVLFRVQALKNSMDLAGVNPTNAAILNPLTPFQIAAQHVKNWPLRDACERLIESCNNLKGNLLAKNKRIGIYMTSAPISIGMLTTLIPAPITDLMRLNPVIVGNPIVPPSTKVRYYL